MIDQTMSVQKWGGRIWSQNGEDVLIKNIFDQLKIEHPSYIDIGAHSPSTISNTKMLYSSGSNGINIEANPRLIENFYRERPNDINLHYGVIPNYSHKEWAPHQTRTFYYLDEWSAINTFDKEQLEAFVASNPGFEIHTMDVPVIGLKHIIDTYWCGQKTKWPDFLNIDVEGLDYAILSEVDLIDGPIIICVECLSSTKKMNTLMYGNEYVPFFRCDINQIYMKKKYYELYQYIIHDAVSYETNT